MENLTAHYKVRTIGLFEFEVEAVSFQVEAVSFQDAAKRVLEACSLTSVASIAVEWDSEAGGTIEFTDCRIVAHWLKYNGSSVLDVRDGTDETRERLHFLGNGKIATLTRLDGFDYLTNGTKLEVGMTIRRYDEIADTWFEGEIGEISSFAPQTGARHSSLALIVDGYAPSPLAEGQLIEVVSPAELQQRETDRRNKIAMQHRDRPWLPFYEDSEY